MNFPAIEIIMFNKTMIILPNVKFNDYDTFINDFDKMSRYNRIEKLIKIGCFKSEHRTIIFEEFENNVGVIFHLDDCISNKFIL